MSSEGQPDVKPPEQLLEDSVEQILPPQVTSTSTGKLVDKLENKMLFKQNI